MAKKGSKFNKYSYEFKIALIEEYLSGHFGGYDAISKRYKMKSSKQLRDWVKKYKEDPQSLTVETRGRKSKNKRKSRGRPKSMKLDEMVLEEQNKYLRMENDILKKLKALLLQYGEH